MNRNKSIIIVWSLVLYMPIQAAMNLYGTVKAPDGAPVAGVTVSLKNAGISVTSDSSGQYAIRSSGAKFRHPDIQFGSLSMTIQNGRIWLETGAPARVSVVRFDPRGRCIETVVDRTLPAGNHMFYPSGRAMPRTIDIYRVTVGKRTMYCRIAGSAGYTFNPGMPSTALPQSTGKMLETDTIVPLDYLEISHPAYFSRTVPVLVPDSALDIAFLACKAALYTPVRIPLHDTAYSPGHEFWISYDSLLDESRCPTGAMCVWEGKADVTCTFGNAVGTVPMVLSTHVLTIDSAAVKRDISLLQVEPYPSMSMSPVAARKAIVVYIGRQLDALSRTMDSLKTAVDTMIAKAPCSTGSASVCRMHFVFDGHACDWRVFYPQGNVDTLKLFGMMDDYSASSIKEVKLQQALGFPTPVCDILLPPDSIVCSSGQCVPVYKFPLPD